MSANNHMRLLDIADRFLLLDSPMYGKVIPHLPAISRIKASLHHVIELKLQDIHVIREFSDVLPGMLPERAIEFKIELRPSTAPIAKAVELKELKIQLQGSLDKATSFQVHPLEVVQCCLWRRRTKSCVYVWITTRSMQL
jgi:hypothetical protein